MKELREYRTSLINRLVNSARQFRSECLAAKDAFAPLGADGWNIHQVAVHTRDVHLLVYGSRVRRTAIETDPEFQNFDGEAYMAEHYSAGEPLEEILDGLVHHVESLADMLRELPSEAWARTSRHVMLGRGLTLQSWVEKDLAHIEEHLGTIRKQKGD
ncbi:MAG TPA: DinB family protein [Anaerolineales bacterium]|nr:DinB family protein [Anaerolineales bacterium]